MLYIWELHSCSVLLYCHVCVHIVYVSYIWSYTYHHMITCIIYMIHTLYVLYCIHYVYIICASHFPIHSFADGHLSCFCLWLLWTLLYIQGSKYLFSVLSDVYLVAEFLGHMLATHLTHWGLIVFVFWSYLIYFANLISSNRFFCFVDSLGFSTVKIDSFPYSFPSWVSFFV